MPTGHVAPVVVLPPASGDLVLWSTSTPGESTAHEVAAPATPSAEGAPENPTGREPVHGLTSSLPARHRRCHRAVTSAMPPAPLQTEERSWLASPAPRQPPPAYHWSSSPDRRWSLHWTEVRRAR